jgi:hypothetical protein
MKSYFLFWLTAEGGNPWIWVIILVSLQCQSEMMLQAGNSCPK